MPDFNVGATSVHQRSAKTAEKFISDVAKGLHQNERLSWGKYRALKKMAKELMECAEITPEDYKKILEKLAEMRKKK